MLTAVATMRQMLDDIDAAVSGNLRVAASVSGDPHVASEARNLVRAVEARQAAYTRLTLVQNIAARCG